MYTSRSHITQLTSRTRDEIDVFQTTYPNSKGTVDSKSGLVRVIVWWKTSDKVLTAPTITQITDVYIASPEDNVLGCIWSIA